MNGTDEVLGKRSLVGAVLAEQSDEWTEARRYMGVDVLTDCRAAATATHTIEGNQSPQTTRATPAA